LLGIGLKGKPRPPILQLVKKINELDAFKVAVDVPTGIDSDTGEVLGEAVKANLTITFYKAKPGLLKASEYTGELIVKDIGLPKQFELYAGPGDVKLVVKERPPHAHKGEFGRLLVIGGSETYSGAPALVALAALRTGVDLTYIAAPEKTAHAISSYSPNLITIKLEGTHLNPRNVEALKKIIQRSTALVVGPGLGLHAETAEAVKEIIKVSEELGKPLLLDADGLKAFAEEKRKLSVPSVLTPHEGEFRLLSGKEPPQDVKEKAEAVKELAFQLNTTILLKGHIDIISDGRRIKYNFTGNPGMTVGGTGDVLSGIVGGLLAKGVSPFEAAAAGAFVNGAAGDFVLKEKGYHMVPTDIIDWIPRIFDNPMCHLEARGNNS
ncbi:NAD(P)H-hydrate dehydratase, partial [Candidatus Bathyarchaeota archaeon]|nr:NAD(P)H-hydrate dehydratase [Candidatus Bathyarchaeota archaeon]